MDATAIVHDLQHKGIIDGGDLEKITTAAGQTLQNRILYKCLEKKCTDEALITVCDMIVAVRDNPKMRALGKDMKGMLEGKCYVSVHAWTSACMCFVCTCMTQPLVLRLVSN